MKLSLIKISKILNCFFWNEYINSNIITKSELINKINRAKKDLFNDSGKRFKICEDNLHCVNFNSNISSINKHNVLYNNLSSLVKLDTRKNINIKLHKADIKILLDAHDSNCPNLIFITGDNGILLFSNEIANLTNITSFVNANLRP